MQDNRIPLARTVRWRRVRSQSIPLLSFALAVTASGWLWQHHGLSVQGIGEVDSPRVDLTSPTAGLVVSLPNQARGQWLVFDHVRAGDVIARIEDQQLENHKTVEIQSPISGTLVAVYCWPGQTVPSGGLIATIAADHGRHVTGYIPEESTLVARPGMQVTMRTRQVGSRPIESEVEQVGQQIERIPRHQRAVSTMPQWGTPVRIKMPSEAALRPGALVDLVFDGSAAR